MSDLLARSCAHWSESRRAEMEAFYRLATADYRHLAEARDWRGLLEQAQRRVGDRPLRLLDVACGSGKFPQALLQYGGLAEAAVQPLSTALLDPSAFSIAEARSRLRWPFHATESFETTLQAFTPPPGGYDIVWATHALYAIPRHELAAALQQFRAAIAPGGVGLIAHSAEAGHYIAFHRQYLASIGTTREAAYVPAELIAATLRDAGAAVDIQQIDYASVAGGGDSAAVEGFLQRCVFDDRLSLADMLATPPLAAYLASCRDGQGWRFPQRAWLITIAG